MCVRPKPVLPGICNVTIATLNTMHINQSQWILHDLAMFRITVTLFRISPIVVSTFADVPCIKCQSIHRQSRFLVGDWGTSHIYWHERCLSDVLPHDATPATWTKVQYGWCLWHRCIYSCWSYFECFKIFMNEQIIEGLFKLWLLDLKKHVRTSASNFKGHVQVKNGNTT